MDALPSILSLNEIARLELSAANMNVNKPWMGYADGIFNPWTFNIQSNKIIPISPNSAGQPPLIPLPDTSSPQFAQLVISDLRQQINSLLFADPLGPVEAPTRTATELALRQRNLAEEIGPIFTRLQQEFLGRLIDRIIHILMIKGLLKPLKIDGELIQLQYKSPLVIAQGKQDVMAYMEYVQSLQAAFQGNYASYIDPVKVPIWIGEKLGIDKSLLPDAQKTEEALSNQSAQAQAAQMSGEPPQNV